MGVGTSYLETVELSSEAVYSKVPASDLLVRVIKRSRTRRVGGVLVLGEENSMPRNVKSDFPNLHEIVATVLRHREGYGYWFRRGSVERVVGLMSQKTFSDTNKQIDYLEMLVRREEFPMSHGKH